MGPIGRAPVQKILHSKLAPLKAIFGVSKHQGSPHSDAATTGCKAEHSVPMLQLAAIRHELAFILVAANRHDLQYRPNRKTELHDASAGIIAANLVTAPAWTEFAESWHSNAAADLSKPKCYFRNMHR